MRKAFLILCALLPSACAKNMSSNVVTDSATAGKVLEGKVISARAVTIKAHDKLQDNTLGGATGGIAGLAAGSQVGHGSGNIAADIGGAVIGAVAGAMIQDSLSTSEGTEYLVKIDKKYLQDFKDMRKKVSASSKSTVQQDMELSSNVGTKTDIISVVQATEPELHVGSRVYIIYNDNHPRLTADSQ